MDKLIDGRRDPIATRTGRSSSAPGGCAASGCPRRTSAPASADADRRRVRAGHERDHTTSATSIAATGASTSACAPGREHRTRQTDPPIPSGTRDVPPDELRELAATTDAMRAVFAARGYGEVATPALEYEAVLVRGTRRRRIALPAVRRAWQRARAALGHDDPDRPRGGHALQRRRGSAAVSYIQHAYRAVRQHRGHPRDPAGRDRARRARPGGHGRGDLRCARRWTPPVTAYRVGLGDARLSSARSPGPGCARRRDLPLPEARDLVGLEAALQGAGHPELLGVAQRRDGPEVLDDVEEAGPLRDVYTMSRRTWPSA